MGCGALPGGKGGVVGLVLNRVVALRLHITDLDYGIKIKTRFYSTKCFQRRRHGFMVICV